QTVSVIDVTISKEKYHFIKQTNQDFFQHHKSVLEHRKKNGCIFDCHGDLHSGNIVIDEDDVCIFDCIEFNKRFRYIDVASDIGFLAMDLDVNNHPFLSSHLILEYVGKSHDISLFDVLNFYKSYRAYVRGKVIGFQLADEQIPHEKRQEIITTAKQYFALAEYYTRLFHLQYTKDQPVLFLISGLTGTGKSTLASKLTVDYHATSLNTDIIRKDLAGINRFERHHDEPDTGLYAPERVKATYEKLLERADELLQQHDSVVLDATFQKRCYREQAEKLAEENNAFFVPIECICPEDIAAQWLQERLKKKTVSDGRWEIYQQQKKTFESFNESEDHIIIDMANDDYEYRLQKFEEILSWMYHGEKS
ncbi:MAG: AAA family ATPase, partial [Thermoplasmatota archaeon]